MKYVIVILDGAAGWPQTQLGGKTSLQAARIPHLDSLARRGLVGLAVTVPEGVEPSSAAACTSILGYDPVENHVGRGAIEAASMGIELAPDEVALRLNLVTLGDDVMRSYAAGHISTAESRAIVAALKEKLDDEVFRLYPGVAYRHILVVKGHPEIMDISFTPPHDISDKPYAPYLPKGEGVALLEEYMHASRAVLANNPVNDARVAADSLPATDVWPFWPGVAPDDMTGFSEKYGKSCAMTSGVDLLNGLASLTGIDRLSIEGVTDGSDTDYSAQVTGALAALDTHDLVVIHIESPDEEGHSGNLEGKIAAIEAIDRDVISAVVAYGEDVRILAMPDHPTPVELKTHVGEPVPFVLAGPGIEHNGASGYSEAQARGTRLVVEPGSDVMRMLLG